jgi:heme-degrading monooxygenase HmoA
MHATVRNYSGKGSKELIDLLEKRNRDVKELITSIKGFVSYSLVRTADSGFSVSVYQDKAGADESMKKAKEWIGQNASATGASSLQLQRVSGSTRVERRT